MRALVLDAARREAENQRYLAASPAQQLADYHRYAKIFRDQPGIPADFQGQWRTRWAGAEFVVPLRAATLWLDWDYALSLSIHDADVKDGYQAFLRHPQRPQLFVDVGANYGTHSLLMLKHGVPTLSFEPLAGCIDYFAEIAALNGVQARCQNIALGSEEGSIELVHPRNQTWLATTPNRLQAEPGTELAQHRCPLSTLDQVLKDISLERVLLKIDTEGHELEVLRGGASFLARVQPYIYFECLDLPLLHQISAFLGSLGYVVASASHSPFAPPPAQAPSDPRITNFLAIPARPWSTH